MFDGFRQELVVHFVGIGGVMVVIVWSLDLQLPVQSVPITTNVVSSNPAQASCTHTTLCDKVCQ